MSVSKKGKRIAIVAAALVIIGAGTGLGIYLYVEANRDPVPTPFDVTKQDGRRYATRNTDLDADELTEDQKTMIEQLEAIGYMTGVNKPVDEGGVLMHDSYKAFPGYGVYLSCHDHEAIMIDLDGTRLHEWKLPEGIWKKKEDIPGCFRKAHVFENGDLMVIYEGVGIVKMNTDSRIIWKKENKAHHDFEVMKNGDIWLLTRKAHIVPEFDEDDPILEDFIVGLRPDGTEFFEMSILDAVLKSKYSQLVGEADPRLPPRFRGTVGRGDVLHSNTLEMVLEDSEDVPWMNKGTIITSSPMLCALMAVDTNTGELVWFFKKDFTGQHEPQILENGNIIFFDNHNHTKHSRVVEFDPRTGETAWEYDGSPDNGFFSQCCSTAYRLPNGNTQITITDMGKIIEVTPDKEIVWEFSNPHRAGENNELVASVFDMVRLPADFPIPWAKHRK